MANRLAGATSPYLMQHADNPVDWWEWGPEPFAQARRRNVPVLLSVGYAACHWCHVMAHESFEDGATAAFLNDHFVAIKVDREERPDVDAVYMRATTAMTGHGGWPMTCVLDHEGLPFFAGTYFPDTPRHGSPSFRQILESLAEAWETRRDEVGRVGVSLREHLLRTVPSTGGPVDPAALDALIGGAVESLAIDFDSGAGGFGDAPKFPPSMVLEFLLREDGPQSRSMLEATCEAMARGGLYDQLGGGFARYSVDRSWVVPHFEKMLYDNAQLLGLYARWSSATGSVLGARVARETADFLLRELRTPQGGLASALDADSEGVEGKFYAWTPAELIDVLGPGDGAWAAGAFSVTDTGTFEHGASTLQLREDVAADRRTDVRARLLAARDDRIRPARDDKVVAAWNGLAISGLCAAGTLLGEPAYVEAAAATGELLAGLHTSHGRLLRVSRDGVAGPHAAVLEDLGCVASAYLDLLQATGDVRWLERAAVVLDDALLRFRADDGGFHDTAADAAEAALLPARPRDPSDNASPGGLSSVLHALVGYAAITGSGRHRSAAEEALATVTGLAAQAPRFAGWLLAAAAVMRRGPLEVAIVGPAGREREALAVAARRVPGTIVLVADAARQDIPLLLDRSSIQGRPAAYVCRGMVCDRPVTDVAALAGLLGRRPETGG